MPRSEIETVLREVNCDSDCGNAEVFGLMTIRHRLEAAKPRAMTLEDAMKLFKGECDGNIVTAVKLREQL